MFWDHHGWMFTNILFLFREEKNHLGITLGKILFVINAAHFLWCGFFNFIFFLTLEYKQIIFVGSQEQDLVKLVKDKTIT